LYSLENLFWKSLWTFCKTDYIVSELMYTVTCEAALGVGLQAVQSCSDSEPHVVLIRLKWNTIINCSNQHVHVKMISSSFSSPPPPPLSSPSLKLSHNDNAWNLPVIHSELIL